jgi:multiple sugar transport system ATP-binding protein
MPSVFVSGLSKSFGLVRVLQDIHLPIEGGDFTVLLGPSGCGKSTLLNAIAGLEDIDQGVIEIDGADVTHREPSKRGIAMVFQSYALYPTMSVRKNLSFGLRVRSVPRQEITRRVGWAAKLLQIDELLDRKPSQLSGGQRQRVAIGRALVQNAQVFLFDEPLSNLDAKLRTEMRVELKRLHQDLGATIVYVTHDQIEAMTLADRVVVMNHGVIEQVGSPQELYHNPTTRFVAGFIGSPAMNFLPVRVQDGKDGGLAVQVTDQIVLPVPPARVDRYGKFKGREMVLGLRPEHLFEYHESGKPGWERVELPVDVVEPMGMETMVHFFVGHDPVCARVDPATHAEPGEMLPLTADLNQMHLMEPDTGRVV